MPRSHAYSTSLQSITQRESIVNAETVDHADTIDLTTKRNTFVTATATTTYHCLGVQLSVPPVAKVSHGAPPQCRILPARGGSSAPLDGGISSSFRKSKI